MHPILSSAISGCLLFPRPSVGDLMALCEGNYVLLRRLVPGLPQASGLLVARAPGVGAGRGQTGQDLPARVGRDVADPSRVSRDGVDLYLSIEHQSRYTTELRLTHFFPVPETQDPRAEPDARLRVYHDARQVEVLDLRQSVLPLRAHYAHPALADKWHINLFLSRWLEYCVRQGYCFDGRAASLIPAARDASTPSCT